MRDTRLPTATPSPEGTRRTLERVGALLGADICWLYRRGYHFLLGDGRSIAIAPESAGRFRVESCEWARTVDTFWVRADDPSRLAEVVLKFAAQSRAREGV